MTTSSDETPAQEHWSSRFNGVRGRMALLLLALLAIPTAYAVIHAIDHMATAATSSVASCSARRG